MTIVRMKRLRILAPQPARRRLLYELARLGCVEVERGGWAANPQWQGVLRKWEEQRGGQAAQALSEVTAALEALKKYAGVKKGMLEPRQRVSAREFRDEVAAAKTLHIVHEINDRAKEIAALLAEENRLAGLRAALLPWQALDIPLDFRPRGFFSIVYGVMPAVLDAMVVIDELNNTIPAADLCVISADKEQQYMILYAFRDDLEPALDIVKASGFSAVQLKGEPGTAAENIARLDEAIAAATARRAALVAEIAEYGGFFPLLGRAYDGLGMIAQRDEILASLGATERMVYLEGWTPAENEDSVARVAAENGCAYQFDDPTEEDDPPVLLRNGRFVTAFGEITNLYGQPSYHSLIDPNPFVAFSYFLFFGLMFSDAAYGLLLIAASLFVLKKAKPAGALKNFMTMALLAGIATTLWGAAFGSWFGDIFTVVSTRFGSPWSPPLLMDPLADPIAMLIMSLGLGMVHLFIGMGVSAYRKIRRGQLLDALFDDVVWYFVIIGAVLALLGHSAGLPLATGGLAVVLLTGGRHNKGLGKLTGGLGALYNNTTGYLSDILSYSRLMALALATGVVASVINTLGDMFGNSVFGWLALLVIFICGQAFNFAISILGAFVHSCRLEYVEFFGKFYEGGGRPFQPMRYHMKYTDVVKDA